MRHLPNQGAKENLPQVDQLQKSLWITPQLKAISVLNPITNENSYTSKRKLCTRLATFVGCLILSFVFFHYSRSYFLSKYKMRYRVPKVSL